MKSVALGVVSLAALAAPAFAADMSYPVKAPPPIIIPVFSWTGFYIGANVGYGGDKFRYPFSAFADRYERDGDAAAAGEVRRAARRIFLKGLNFEDSLDLKGTFDLTSSGFFGGGQIGYNYQFDNSWVIGVEADFEWSGIEGELSGNANLF